MSSQNNKKKGFVPLYHSVLDNPVIMKDADHLALWVLLLLLARHEQRQELLGGRPIMVKAGQFTTGRKQLGQRLDNTIKGTKIERILKSFESAQQIRQQTTTKNRLITILNWQDYKIGGQQNGQQSDNERTTSGQRADTHKELKNERIKELKRGRAAPLPHASRKILKDPIIISDLERKFPGIDVIGQIEQMEDWLDARGKVYKDYVAFARNWLKKPYAQNRYDRRSQKGSMVVIS